MVIRLTLLSFLLIKVILHHFVHQENENYFKIDHFNQLLITVGRASILSLKINQTQFLIFTVQIRDWESQLKRVGSRNKNTHSKMDMSLRIHLKSKLREKVLGQYFPIGSFCTPPSSPNPGLLLMRIRARHPQ